MGMRRVCAPIYQFGTYVVLFLFCSLILQERRKEKDFQDAEHEE